MAGNSIDVSSVGLKARVSLALLHSECERTEYSLGHLLLMVRFLSNLT
jgi:hypothetical protein